MFSESDGINYFTQNIETNELTKDSVQWDTKYIIVGVVITGLLGFSLMKCKNNHSKPIDYEHLDALLPN